MCAGIAEHLEVSRRWVHITMAVLAVLGPGIPIYLFLGQLLLSAPAIVLALLGPGLPIYLFLWAVTPSSDLVGGQREPGALRAVSGLGESRWGTTVAIGGLLVFVGTVVGLQFAGVDVRDRE